MELNAPVLLCHTPENYTVDNAHICNLHFFPIGIRFRPNAVFCDRESKIRIFSSHLYNWYFCINIKSRHNIKKCQNN